MAGTLSNRADKSARLETGTVPLNGALATQFEQQRAVKYSIAFDPNEAICRQLKLAHQNPSC